MRRAARAVLQVALYLVLLVECGALVTLYQDWPQPYKPAPLENEYPMTPPQFSRGGNVLMIPGRDVRWPTTFVLSTGTAQIE